MAIIKRNGRYQTKVRCPDRTWICRTFLTRKEAEAFEFQTSQQIRQGTTLKSNAQSVTLDEYFAEWFETVQTRASAGWRKEQLRMYKQFISPFLGGRKMTAISPQMVSRVLNGVAEQGRSEQTQLHVYNIMRKMFGDAIEVFRLLTFNPVQKAFKPRVAVKETAYLNLSDAKALLLFVRDKPYGTAIWLQIYLGLRIGEMQALTWNDVNLKEGIVHIRRTYVRKEKRMKDYPKGRRHHSHRIPLELLEALQNAKEFAISPFVVTSPEGTMVSYEWYFRTLKRYCKAAGCRAIGTHGLRHSTSGLYLAHGANAEDMRQLFAHSSSQVTQRYLHHEGTNLVKVATNIKLFSNVSQMFPKAPLNQVDTTRANVVSNVNQ